MIGDPGQYVGKPCLRIDVGELRRLDQRIHDGRSVATAVRAAECPVAAPDGDATNAALGGILDRQMRPSSRKRVNAAQWLSW